MISRIIKLPIFVVMALFLFSGIISSGASAQEKATTAISEATSQLVAQASSPPTAVASSGEATEEKAEPSFTELVDSLSKGGFSSKAKTIALIAASGNPSSLKVIEALQGKNLFFRKSDKKVFITQKSANGVDLLDPVSGAKLGTVEKSAVKRIRVNNKLRRAIRAGMSLLVLLSEDPAKRLEGAISAFTVPDVKSLPALEKALSVEKSEDVKTAISHAIAATILISERSDEEKIEAVSTLKKRRDRDARSLLAGVMNAPGELGAVAKKAVAEIDQELALWSVVQNTIYGLSLGSVLLLAAIGLAITFGVMGVINMAHGEMVMLGAYTTFVVQEIIRASAPQLFDYSLIFAVPLAFVVVGSVGIAIERGVIRHLYGRPLETLLATWGISLILQQTVRSIFGPNNREVGNPEFMAGSFELANLTLTYNRIWIIVFALMVFFILLMVLKYTSFGLKLRAVTQNRPMAGALGIRTGRLDALTFGLGSGIAGIAGVALSQIDNVSPNLGQTYIIDSFMVVVFGGVGNLWGTLVGGFTLGVANKFLEPYAGAVLGKIVVLVLIILFIQKRPRGLFALKGRAVE